MPDARLWDRGGDVEGETGPDIPDIRGGAARGEDAGNRSAQEEARPG
jgi:hypothetical protein